MFLAIASKHKTTALLGALAFAGLASALPAGATTVVLSGSGQLSWTAEFLGSSGGNIQTTPTGSDGNDYMLSVPGNYTFLDTFSQQSNVLTGAPASSVGTYAFQDTYKFSLNQTASGDALTVSLGLSTGSNPPIFDIANLQFRLYEVASSAVQPGLNIPTSGATLITSWTGNPGQSTGASIQASFSNLEAGTYFLDVAGTADGAQGGTYVGQLNLATPVPLPAALPLLLSGLGLLGGLRRRAA